MRQWQFSYLGAREERVTGRLLGTVAQIEEEEREGGERKRKEGNRRRRKRRKSNSAGTCVGGAKKGGERRRGDRDMIEIGLSPWKKREENMLGSVVASVQCTVCMALFWSRAYRGEGL